MTGAAFTLEGSITFRLPGRAIALEDGDRMIVEPGLEHSTMVGSAGVRYTEAHVR